MVTMPRSKGKANYKVDLLILVVEEKLPNGAQAWQEVAALYQARSGEGLLRDHDDVKRHWTDKCCNKFKKPTGSPGDPKRDMILRCQRIHQRILKKSASSIMGADSEGDEGLSLSEDSEDSELGEDEEEASGDLLGDGVGVAIAGGLMADEQAVAAELAGGIGGRSRNTTPTNVHDAGVDGDLDGGIRIMAPDELPIAPVPPLQYATQQSAEGAAFLAPHYYMPQSTEGATHAPLDMPRYGQAFLTPDMTPRPYQQLYTASGHGAFAPLQQRAAVPPQPQTGVVTAQPQPAGQEPGLTPPPPTTFYSTISQEEGEKRFGVFIKRQDKELPFQKERVNC
jgi:hypothetical protein